MATIRPFKGYRPKPEYAEKIAALPYDVMISKEAREMVKDNPLSFLHVDRGEIDLPETVGIYSSEVYENAAKNLNKLLKENYLQDNTPSYYVYELTMCAHKQTGIVACTAIDEFLDGTIKKHELTRETKELDRTKHVDVCNAHTGPIFMAYRAEKIIDEIVDDIKTGEPVYDFVADDNIAHKVWVVSDKDIISRLSKAFESVDSLYIADGHHRNMAAVNVCLERRGEGEYDKNAEFNYCMSVLFPDNQLKILDYNRVVTDLNGFTEEEFLSKVREIFDIVACGYSYKPDAKHCFGMYLNYTWYKLTFKENLLKTKEIVQGLDSSILQNYILTPVLGISDPRKDKRIDFIGGNRGIKELERRVNSREMRVAFALYPTSLEDLMTVADEEKLMPPKSTWFEPKLRSGIFVHKLD